MPKVILGITMYALQEVAEMLSVTTKTVQNYLKADRIKGRRLAEGGTLRKIT